jgi:Tfp pilus assembly protein PilF
MRCSPIIGLTVALVCHVDRAVAKTPAEIESIATAVTVEIRLLQDESIGSGIIIERQGDLYTLITNRHVACGKESLCSTPSAAEIYILKLGDGQQYEVAAKSVEILDGNLDLAIVRFRSNRAYPVAQVAAPGSLKIGDKVFTSGYPATSPVFSFNVGRAIAVVDRRLSGDRGGYTVIYNAETQPGMSGGGVFNEAGRLVAIHGQGERYRDNTQVAATAYAATNTVREEVGTKVGYNRGIPIHWIVAGLTGRGRRSENPQPIGSGTTADEHFITGFNNLVEPGIDILAGKRSAINEFSQAIRIDPRYSYAYFLRAYTYQQLDNPQGALADYDRAIALNPNSPAAHNNRGSLKYDKLNDVRGALADYDRAIALNPNTDSGYYYNRGNLKDDKLNDVQGALADYDRAIKINPNFAEAYGNRGNLKADRLNDSQGALADYDRAIELNPNFAIAYNSRANLKREQLNDARGALADYDRAIQISSNFAEAYYNRGALKRAKLSDTQGALADMNRAAKLFQQQGNTQNYQGAIDALRLWGHSGDRSF